MESKKYAFSRFLYIVEAALEYFVSIAVGDSEVFVIL